ncbi:uncharacterized protein HaLaN_04578, partial [Haematococcus lacustris]
GEVLSIPPARGYCWGPIPGANVRAADLRRNWYSQAGKARPTCQTTPSSSSRTKHTLVTGSSSKHLPQGIEKILQEGAEGLGPEVVTPTGPNQYRPPAGFMNEQLTETPEFAAMAPQDMMNRLRARAGKWHQLAKMLPLLAKAGYDNTTVDEMTGITPVLQVRRKVAEWMYDTLVASGKLSPELLASFDSRGEDMLYPFRNLTQEMREAAAEYVVQQNYDATACEVLARSMKEWERRPVERTGFTDHPGDCMAFKYLRDALECTKVEEAEKKMQQALSVAVTDDARARLYEAQQMLLGDAPETPSSGPEDARDRSPTASLTILRLELEDLGFRPIPVLGELGTASPSDLDAAPRTSQEGVFGIFSIQSRATAHRWVALPQWKALAMMQVPVGFTVANLASVPAVVSGTRSKTDDDKKRLNGPGIIVADRGAVTVAALDNDTYYLASALGASTEAKLQLVDGAQVRTRGLKALATVAFIARPPARDARPLSTS